MNPGKLEVVKQMARVNIDILGICEVKWTGMDEFNSNDLYIYNCGQESLRRNGVALMSTNSPKCSTWVQSQKWQMLLVLSICFKGKLEVVKQEMAKVNINILGITDLKWTGMGEFNSDDHYIYYCGQEFLRRNGVAIIVNKRVWDALLGCNLKNDKMISLCFQGKPFNITVIQVSAPTNNAEEVEVEWFYEDIQDLLELTSKKMSFSL